jgi:radical SAM superfamily enzyme YgiQ (UPF0313 family)
MSLFIKVSVHDSTVEETVGRAHDIGQIILCDLTHVHGDSISSNVFPLGVGLIAAYVASSDLRERTEFELFKYPEDLNRRLSAGRFPRVIGFANYSWSLELSVAFARAIKAASPDTIVVFGGPNYGLSDEEIDAFWATFGDCIDFNVVLEGEIGFHALLGALLANDFDCVATKRQPDQLRNVHFRDSAGRIVKSEISPRIPIDDLPSPYIDTALMEKFFDGKLIPLTHTTRGCPFKCTFCSEGAEYYNKVKQRTSRLTEEFRFIAQRATAVGMFDLMLSDANYGMFKEDSERADALAGVQDEFGYPKNVYVSTGKNQKARVLAAVKKLRGAIQLSASLQTTNEQVLENIERSNISLDVLSEAARDASESNLTSYTELILGLPGETLDSHLQSVIDVINAGFTNVRIYQLILLPQTELNNAETRKRYGFETAFRPMPRSYGVYDLLGERKVVSEYEEIVVSTSSMTRTDYEIARKCALTVEMIHNGKIFKEVMQLLHGLDLRWGDFMAFVLGKVRAGRLPARMSTVLDAFVDFMNSRFFPSREALLEATSGQKSTEALQALSINEIAHFKARVILSEFEMLNAFVFDSLEEFVRASSTVVPRDLLHRLSEYCALSKSRPFDDVGPIIFRHELSGSDARKLWSIITARQISSDDEQEEIPPEWVLDHEDSQKSEIARLLRMYGKADDGLSRIVMRAPVVDSYFRRSSGGARQPCRER